MCESPNPYQSPPSVDEAPPSWWQRIRHWFQPQAEARYEVGDDASLLEFLRGRCLFFEGVVFFVDRGDRTILHAAIALRSDDRELVDRSCAEVVRVLQIFFRYYPDIEKGVTGRQLCVRFLRLYTDFDDEVRERKIIGTIPLPREAQELHDSADAVAD
ncbi:hypothetical protein RMSM_06272 [Rhodopirellula maiorica SM1]|uniref:Uncharacterized protein n=1 Tax=Rhodopirellula maiorica SM1 TaxID=1265738 RepID=M5RBF5_9BACT|nr:hypothetical protein [Rhodopirellula maiorica]EMI16803.1 hypothetical protein RMSM_06272 [Rhodopirellula maiorica SM1]